jgi:hypothetical protein
VILSTTGYTGAGGCEVYMKNEDALKVFDAIFEAGKEFNIVPAGLGCRDTLRLEMGFCLYGNDIDDDHSPLEANLGWITKFNDVKGDFVDRDYMLKQKAEGLKRRLCGFELIDRGVPRHGYEICNAAGEIIGNVTSGIMLPNTKVGIGMGYVKTEFAKKENIIYIKEKKDIVCGTDYVWHCEKYAELECVLGLVKIVPCAEFKELQEWLKKNAKFDLRITDLYTCDVCQKRSSKSYSNIEYTATNPYECKRLLEKLKAEYKNGNKVVAELAEFEDIDGDEDRYEYEQYGYKEIKLQVRISTPTGRNERLIA